MLSDRQANTDRQAYLNPLPLYQGDRVVSGSAKRKGVANGSLLSAKAAWCVHSTLYDCYLMTSGAFKGLLWWCWLHTPSTCWLSAEVSRYRKVHLSYRRLLNGGTRVGHTHNRFALTWIIMIGPPASRPHCVLSVCPNRAGRRTAGAERWNWVNLFPVTRVIFVVKHQSSRYCWSTMLHWDTTLQSMSL